MKKTLLLLVLGILFHFHIYQASADIWELFDEANSKEVYWKLDLEHGDILTSTWETMLLKIAKSSPTSIKIPQNTYIVNYHQADTSVIYPAIQIDEEEIISWDYIVINNKKITVWNVAWLFSFNQELGSNIYLSRDVEIEFFLKRSAEKYPVHVYYLNDFKNGWKKLDYNDYIMNPQSRTITVNTNKFWYYIIIQNRYLEANSPTIWELQNVSSSLDDTSSSNITFWNVEDTLKQTLTNSQIQSLAESFYTKMLPDMTYFDYFRSFDTQLNQEYNLYAQAHYNLFIALEKYLLTNDQSEKVKVVQNLRIISQAIKKEKDLKTKYITIKNNYFIPNDQSIKQATASMRNKVETKLDTLYSWDIITQDAYNTAKHSYNQFILHLTLFFQFDQIQSAQIQAINQAKIFIPIYNQ